MDHPLIVGKLANGARGDTILGCRDEAHFVSPDGDVIWLIQTNANTVFQWIAKRRSRERDRR